MSNNDRHELNEEEAFRQQALDYHALPIPGKIAIALTKPADSAKDLALAYSLVLQNLFAKSHRTLITFINTQQKAIPSPLFLTVPPFLV